MTQLAPTENAESDRSQSDPAPAEPDKSISLSYTAADLFEIAHGYKRNNPPKYIPNRRRDEDFRSQSIFWPVKVY